ncbi:hypothetical protein AYI69_g4895 [Smittium culicis]|uniref:Uncharacterized protein n=1 Tax=Smittium culicis TaxID=133412 RepID=A0A1R1Y9S6_9FUNG|nr:hypothetical protein AYI69_g4895 [Smittium culicis]
MIPMKNWGTSANTQPPQAQQKYGEAEFKDGNHVVHVFYVPQKRLSGVPKPPGFSVLAIWAITEPVDFRQILRTVLQ